MLLDASKLQCAADEAILGTLSGWSCEGPSVAPGRFSNCSRKFQGFLHRRKQNETVDNGMAHL